MDAEYIVVGAGSAGCAVACRLVERGARVTLLEAGPKDRDLRIHIPATLRPLLHHPTLNWNYSAEPVEGSAGRRIYLPRGKVLGGSSSINGMLYVRGNPADYDGWAQMGCRGWSYDEVLPYFKKSEDNERGDSDIHGTGGPLGVSDVTEKSVICEAMIAAGQESGIPYNDDINGRVQEGIGYHQATIRNGRRSSTAVAYLNPARKRPNLDVEANAIATKVILEGKRAVGVAYEKNGVAREARAGRSVILSGGAFNSPQLLELSGIGAPERLRDLGLPVNHELPGVGENLQDHFVVRMRWRVKNALTFNERVRGLRALGEGVNYVLRRKGVLSMPTLPIGAFVRTRRELASPDVQFQILPATYRAVEDRKLDKEPGVTIGVTMLRLDGRGHVHLKSSDPKAPPAIWHNMLATDGDRATSVAAMWMARRMMEAPAFKPYYDFEMDPGPDAADDDAFLEYARRTGASNWHPAGTCKMGVDPMAVVDPSLAVHGMAGLRVVDASIMPNVICGNTNAPTIMIAEKAADMILAS
ncbi:MAG: GMC family oxidoreductase [Alphaproteobacteria bacterium]